MAAVPLHTGEESALKIRIKFSKDGPVRFVGHLDTMRYFQKAIRRAGLPAAYSSGFSPHMIMSFAAPLGVGTAGRGEYFDLELTEPVPVCQIIDRLNDQMAEGFRILNVVEVPGGKAQNAMSLVAAADYLLYVPGEDWAAVLREDVICDFLAQEEILITKTGKSGDRQVDIRPFIYEMRIAGSEDLLKDTRTPQLFLRLASASANYTRPDQVFDAFCSWTGLKLPPFCLRISRLEIYADLNIGEKHRLVALDRLGERIE